MAECKRALDERKLPHTVWVSEDATCINGRVEYDAKGDRCIGFVGPPDKNGLPDLSTFGAPDAETIERLFATHVTARNAHLVLAQPLQKHAAPFWLLLFGTDNKYPKEVVIRRWEYLNAQAEKEGVRILGFSSDGDTRFLSAMKWKCFRPDPENPPEWTGWFGVSLNLPTLFVQDVVHILTKLRNRFLKASVHLPMGEYVVSASQLRHVVETESRLTHDLTMTDLNNKDRMNFRAVPRMTSDAVLDCVRKQPDSDGTQAYLQVMRDVMDSFLKKDLAADRRVFLLWRALFFLRNWRHWLLKEGHELTDKYITINAYVCVEIDAHCLLLAVRRLRDEGSPEFFLPHLFSSQPCESAFRDARSQSSTNETAVNFSINGMLRRGGRIELQGIIASQLGDEFEFPRETRRQAVAQQWKESLQGQGLPSDEVILRCIDEARRSANDLVQWLGMEVDAEADCCPQFLFRHSDMQLEDSDDDTNSIHDELSVAEDLDLHDLAVLEEAERAQPESGAGSAQPPPPPRNCTVYTVPNGVQVTVRKSTLCWRLGSRNLTRMSADRLLRVQQGRAADPHSDAAPRPSSLQRADTLGVMEWCAFRSASGPLVGRVLAFRSLSGHTERSRQYFEDRAPKCSRALGVLGSWFTLNENGILKYLPSDHDVKPLHMYICTIPPPNFIDNMLQMNSFVFSCIYSSVENSV